MYMREENDLAVGRMERGYWTSVDSAVWCQKSSIARSDKVSTCRSRQGSRMKGPGSTGGS